MAKFLQVLGFLVSAAAAAFGILWLYNKWCERHIDDEIDEECEEETEECTGDFVEEDTVVADTEEI